MGLVLELYPQDGANDFYCDDIQVTLDRVRHEFSFDLLVHTPAMKSKHKITDRQSTVILPGVRVSAGAGADIEKHGVKVVIEAPRRIKIYRGAVYRKIKEPPVE